MTTYVGSIIVTGMTSPFMFGWRVIAILVEAENKDEAVGICHRRAREQNLFPEIQSDRVVDVCLMAVTSDTPITIVK
jgi:hypothetical protein